MATEMLNFRKKILKNLLIRSHMRAEAETLHKLCFYCCCACGFVAMATLSFHRFIMGKVTVGLYLYLTLCILTKASQ